MKKTILILMTCLMSAMSANAADWVSISETPDMQVYIDADSVKYVKYDTCTYAMLYKSLNKPAKVAYMKSNYSQNKAGVVRVEDFEEDKYRPGYYSSHGGAFMKTVTEDSVINLAHNYALSLYPEKGAPNYKTQLSPTSMNYVNSVKKNEDLGLADVVYNSYIRSIKNKIFANWEPTVAAQNTEVTYMLNIGNDGSLKGYKLVKSNATDDVNRVALAAISKAAPFEGFPENSYSNVESINVEVTFDYNFIRRYVK